MFCSHCGALLQDGAKFCSSCGAAQKAAPKAETPAQGIDFENTFGEFFSPGPEPIGEFFSPRPEPVQPAAEPVIPEPTAPETPAAQAANTSGYYQPSGSAGRRADSAGEQKPRKKKKGALIGILIAVAVVIVVRLLIYAVVNGAVSVYENYAFQDEPVISESYDSKGKGSDSDGKGKTAESDSGDKGKVVQSDSGAAVSSVGGSDEYNAVFSAQGIEPESCLQGGDGDYAAFVEVDTEGWIYQYEFLCDGDIIHTMADSVYIPLEGYSEEEIEMLESIYEELFADVVALDFCRMEMMRTQGCLKIVIYQEDTDSAANVQALEAAGYLDGEGGGLLSMEMTREGMLEAGAVEY